MPFCGIQAAFVETAALKAPLDSLVYFDGAPPPSITDEFFRGEFRRAADHIESLCGVRFDFTDDRARATERVIATQLDGPGGVLADQQLPYEGMRTLRMRVDFERWGTEQLPLWLVFAHELGHYLGYGHDTQPRVALMDPALNTEINGYQPHEVEMLRRDYRPPRPRRAEPNPPPVSPGPSGLVELYVRVGGKEYRVPLLSGS